MEHLFLGAGMGTIAVIMSFFIKDKYGNRDKAMLFGGLYLIILGIISFLIEKMTGFPIEVTQLMWVFAISGFFALNLLIQRKYKGAILSIILGVILAIMVTGAYIFSI